MFPASFDYHRATSVEEALRLLGENDDAKLLAGGHSLIPMMKLRLAQPGAVIDIGRVDALRGIMREGNTVRIGPLTTHAELASSAELAEICPLIGEAAAQIGDPVVRNKGTIGGNIAHADPASDLPAALLAVGATIHMQGPGGARSVAAADFFTDLLATDLREGEILTAIEIAWLQAASGSAYLKAEHPASGYAVCGAAAIVTLDGATCREARLCFNGVTAVPHHAKGVGEALVGSTLADDDIDAAIGAHLTLDEPLGDVYASGEYRAQLARNYGRRALAQARDRARA